MSDKSKSRLRDLLSDNERKLAEHLAMLLGDPKYDVASDKTKTDATQLLKSLGLVRGTGE